MHLHTFVPYALALSKMYIFLQENEYFSFPVHLHTFVPYPLALSNMYIVL